MLLYIVVRISVSHNHRNLVWQGQASGGVLRYRVRGMGCATVQGADGDTGITEVDYSESIFETLGVD